MIVMGEAQQPIDLVPLCDQLRRKGELEAAGGPAYLAQLVDGVPHVSHLEHYARIVKEKSLLRNLIHVGHSMQQSAFEADEESFAILGRARLALSQLEQQQDAGIFDTWAEFQNAKPLRGLIEGFLWADVANVVGGLSGEGKTFILFANTKALLSGQPLFGHFRVLEPLDHVLYLIPECSRAPYLHR
jgi:DnaB-like helicase N terminal domain